MIDVVTNDENSMLDAVEDFIWILALLINQAVLAHNIDIDLGLATGEKEKPVTVEYLRIKVTPGLLFQQKEIIIGAITEDCHFDAPEDEAAADPDLAEIQASKNA